jgi:hypothetical protein
MDADNSGSTDTRWKDSTAAKATRSAGSSLSDSGRSMMDSARSDAASRTGPVSYQRGGKVRKTGLARLHRGEVVLRGGKGRKGRARASKRR